MARADADGRLRQLWVYLSATPLFGLTATLGVYLLAHAVYRRLDHAPWANPVLWTVVVLALLLLATGTPYPVYFSGAQFIHFLLGPGGGGAGLAAVAAPCRAAPARPALLVAALLGGAAASGSAVAIGWALGLPADVLRRWHPSR
jgi:putative effector of murein hydrolase